MSFVSRLLSGVGIGAPTVDTSLEATERLGSELREADNAELPYRLILHLLFDQDYEFVARRGEFRGKHDEL
jgi:sporulation-control protein spo0M